MAIFYFLTLSFSRDGLELANDPRTCPWLHLMQPRAKLASFVRNIIRTDPSRRSMREAYRTTHPTRLRTDDIKPLASKTTQLHDDPLIRTTLSDQRSHANTSMLRCEVTSRRRSPMAAVRWGEAAHPGPLGDGSYSRWRRNPTHLDLDLGFGPDPGLGHRADLDYGSGSGPGPSPGFEPFFGPEPAPVPDPDSDIGPDIGPDPDLDLDTVAASHRGDQPEEWDDSAPEEVAVLPTTDVDAPTPVTHGRGRLRAPSSMYHLFCGGIGGYLGVMAAGFHLVGGCDTSESARQAFTNYTRAPTVERVEKVDWKGTPPDAILATPPTDGFSVGKSTGAETAAAHAFLAAVTGILSSGTTVGIIETVWEVTTAQSGSIYRRMVKQALNDGYTSYFRYASPHRCGGGEVRSRLFIFLVKTEAVERVGPFPLLALSRGGVPKRTVRACLTPTDDRPEIRVGPIRWRRTPRRVGAAVLLGHYGRGGNGDADLLDSVWSIDGVAPPTEDMSKVVYACDGQLVRLTPRELARVRGIHDSVDIGEGDGPRHARNRVRRSPSVAAVHAAAAATKDYLQLIRDAARDDAGNGPTPPKTNVPTENETTTCFSDGSPQWCTVPSCLTCERANTTPVRPRRSLRSCADAFRTLAGAAFLRQLRREGGCQWDDDGERHEPDPEDGPQAPDLPDRSTMLEPGEQVDHSHVCQKMNASWHGFRYIYADLDGAPYRKVKQVPCVMRTLCFWRFPTTGYGSKFRLWARGAPAFRQHAWHGPTRSGNYASGEGETASDFIQSLVADGILIPVTEEKVKAMISSEQAAINPIATIPKATPGQFRFLVDCRRSGTNWMLAKLPSHFPETLDAIHCVVPKDGFSWTSDMLDCFYSFPLAEGDSWLFVVEFQGHYFRYGQLAQGSKTSPHVCLGFGYTFIELFRARRGCHHVLEQVPGTETFDPSAPAVQFVDDAGRIDALSLHMDDILGGGRTRQEAFELMRDYHHYAGGMGMNPKWSKLVPPTQTGTDYGGFSIDSRNDALEIRLKRAAQQQLHAAALGALSAVRNPARSLARLAGLSERAFLLNRAFRAFLSRYYAFASRVNGEWNSTLRMQTEERKDVRQIVSVAQADKCYSRHAKVDLNVQLGDASGFRAGGAVSYADGNVTAWTGPFPQAVIVKFGSNIKELRRVLMQMQRHVADETAGRRSVAGSTLYDFTDSQYTADVLESGRAETVEASAIIRAIRRACFTLNVKLYVFHCAGTRLVENGIDGLSRKHIDGSGLDIGDWAAALAPAIPSPEIMATVEKVFGGRRPQVIPISPGEMAGQRLVVFPRPWSAVFWAEAIKRACVIDTTTDVVVVIPRRGESLWKRSFRIFHEIGSVRAGEWTPWPKEEHESLHFYWLPSYDPPPPHRDRYFFKHGSASMRQALLRQREKDPPTRAESASSKMRWLFEQPTTAHRSHRL